MSMIKLTRHCLATGAVMKKAAEFLSEDAVTWETIGILHDIDFQLDRRRHGHATVLKERDPDP